MWLSVWWELEGAVISIPGGGWTDPHLNSRPNNKFNIYLFTVQVSRVTSRPGKQSLDSIAAKGFFNFQSNNTHLQPVLHSLQTPASTRWQRQMYLALRWHSKYYVQYKGLRHQTKYYWMADLQTFIWKMPEVTPPYLSLIHI